MAKIKTLLLCVALYLLNGLANAQSTQSNAISKYLKSRSDFIKDETRLGLGGKLILNPKETRLNNYIMKLKAQDIKKGLFNPTTFAPAQHYFEVVNKINETPLFKIIQDMPKGGVLHAHNTAVCNLDFFISLTYWDHLWQLTDPVTQLPEFLFSRTQPACGWVLVKDERKRKGARAYDSQLRALLSLYSDDPVMKHGDLNTVWAKFDTIFQIVGGVMKYKAAMEAYYLETLKEFEADGVNYLELRSSLSKVREEAMVTI